MQEPGADTAEGDKAASKVAANWQLPVMLAVSKAARAGNTMLPAPLDSADADMQALPVPMPLIVALAGQKLALDKDLRTEQAKRRVHDALKELVLVRPVACCKPLRTCVEKLGRFATHGSYL